MRLLPSQQTQAQLEALRKFLDEGKLALAEPCNCRGQVRHNNGGNYHEHIQARADGGKWWVCRGSTSDYDDSEYEEIEFPALLDLIQQKAAEGYDCR